MPSHPDLQSVEYRRLSDLVSPYFVRYLETPAPELNIPNWPIDPPPRTDSENVQEINWHNAGGLATQIFGPLGQGESTDVLHATAYFALHAKMIAGQEEKGFKRGMAYNGMIGDRHIFEGTESSLTDHNDLPICVTDGEFVCPNALPGTVNPQTLALGLLLPFKDEEGNDIEIPRSMLALGILETARYAAAYNLLPAALSAQGRPVMHVGKHTHGARAGGVECPSDGIIRHMAYARTSVDRILAAAKSRDWNRFVDKFVKDQGDNSLGLPPEPAPTRFTQADLQPLVGRLNTRGLDPRL